MVRFQVLTATSMKTAVFWDVAPCSLVDIDDVSEVLAVSIIRVMSLVALVIETVSTSETSVNIYQASRRNVPEDNHLRVQCFCYKIP
jgi:hypothetical protein